MIRMLVMDVDGTLTDGKIYVGPNGEMFKAFNVKDGYGINRAKKANIIPVILTGRMSEIVRRRAEELQITEVHQGINNKVERLLEIISRYSVEISEVAYIGDDNNDLECMKQCGLKGCPQNASLEVKKVADYIAPSVGGEGAVREFIDYIIACSSYVETHDNIAL